MIKDYYENNSISTTIILDYPNSKIVEICNSSDILIYFEMINNGREKYEKTYLDSLGNEKSVEQIDPFKDKSKILYEFKNIYNIENKLIKQIKLNALSNTNVEIKTFYYDTLSYSKIIFIQNSLNDTLQSIYFKNGKLAFTREKTFDGYDFFYNEYDSKGNLTFEDVKQDKLRFYYIYKETMLEKATGYKVKNGKVLSNDPTTEILYTYEFDKFNRPIISNKIYIGNDSKPNKSETVLTKYFNWIWLQKKAAANSTHQQSQAFWEFEAFVFLVIFV